MQRSSEEMLRCSFCHKSQDVVAKLISTPKRYPPAYICDECVAVCNSILEKDSGVSPGNLSRPTPQDSANETKNWLQRLKSWWDCGMIEGIVFKH